MLTRLRSAIYSSAALPTTDNFLPQLVLNGTLGSCHVSYEAKLITSWSNYFFLPLLFPIGTGGGAWQDIWMDPS